MQMLKIIPQIHQNNWIVKKQQKFQIMLMCVMEHMVDFKQYWMGISLVRLN